MFLLSKESNKKETDNIRLFFIGLEMQHFT